MKAPKVIAQKCLIFVSGRWLVTLMLEAKGVKTEEDRQQLEEEKAELWKEKLEEEEHRRQAEQKCRDLELELAQHVKDLAAAADSSAISRLTNRIASLQESLKFSAAALQAVRPGKGNLNRRSRASDIKL